MKGFVGSPKPLGASFKDTENINGLSFSSKLVRCSLIGNTGGHPMALSVCRLAQGRLRHEDTEPMAKSSQLCCQRREKFRCSRFGNSWPRYGYLRHYALTSQVKKLSMIRHWWISPQGRW